MDKRSDPNLRCDAFDRFLGRVGGINAARDTATLSQRGARGLIGLICQWHLPRHGRGREGGLGRTEESLGKGRMQILTERAGVTGVGLIVLGAVNNLFWDWEPGEEGSCLKV